MACPTVTSICVGSVGKVDDEGWCKASGSITLIEHECKTILVDCGGTHQWDKIKRGQCSQSRLYVSP